MTSRGSAGGSLRDVVHFGITALAAATCIALTLAAAPAAGSTLVTKLPGGDYGPGVAASWKALGDGLVLELNDAAKAAEVAGVLRERLSGLKVAVQGTQITATGIPGPALLDQLSVLSLEGEGADPLAELAGLGGGTTMAAPEGGGSIRASKPTASLRPRILQPHDPAERVVAEVVEVTRGEFPLVKLKLKVRSAAKSGPLKAQLKRGKVIEGEVVLGTEAGGVAFYEANTQRNIGAYYLARGDRISVHAVGTEDGRIEIDYVARQ